MSFASSRPWPSPLIPISQFQHGFTSSSSLQAASVIAELGNLSKVDLDDKALGVHKVFSRTAHPLVSPPSPSPHYAEGSTNVHEDTEGSSTVAESFLDAIASQDPLNRKSQCSSQELDMPPPELAWEALYPRGSINPSGAIPGGFGFYLAGTKEFSDALAQANGVGVGATEIVMSYRMMLERGWEWAKGGKLPGIYGGIGDLAYGCTGGRQDNRDKCFNIRLMWRSEGAGELYVYLPFTPNNKKRLLAVPPLSLENPDFGFSVGRGSFSFPVARWMSIALRVKLNAAGNADGEIELWIDGVSVVSATNLTLRNSEESRLRGMHFQTFFGGQRPDWASPKNQRAWFADVTGVIVQ